MKAMIFAAGLGTRLAPLTDTCPKALIQVGDKPMLRRAVERLRDAGVSEIIVNVHHHADMIIDYLAQNDFGIPVKVSDERDALLDTGGGVVKASRMLMGDEPVILYNADIFTDFPITEMLDAHHRSEADVTLLADNRDTSRYLLFDAEGRMRAV
ncbi:MAG: NTP transferase domain-containing protein [Duncaniella sp.]|nr:NTP transferase domain-containing protein [Duncaniella sp.]